MSYKWSNWRPLTAPHVARAHDGPGVYEIRRSSRHVPVAYPDGGSRKLYIGSSERSTKDRLERHASGSGDAVVASEIRRGRSLEYRVRPARFPTELEDRRLRDFHDAHGSCPKGNEVCPSPSQRKRSR